MIQLYSIKKHIYNLIQANVLVKFSQSYLSEDKQGKQYLPSKI